LVGDDLKDAGEGAFYVHILFSTVFFPEPLPHVLHDRVFFASQILLAALVAREEVVDVQERAVALREREARRSAKMEVQPRCRAPAIVPKLTHQIDQLPRHSRVPLLGNVIEEVHRGRMPGEVEKRDVLGAVFGDAAQDFFGSPAIEVDVDGPLALLDVL
jgi:hypothetical protein